jgi:phytanoyl-CoA hydroxylase
MLNPNYKFDPACITEYAQKGYVNVGKIFTDEFTDLLIQDIDSNHGIRQDFNYAMEAAATITQSIHIWYKGKVAQQVLGCETLAQVVRELTGCKEHRLWHDQSQYKLPKVGGINQTHQDLVFWPFIQPYTQITAWIALDDATIENGCMHMVPGSHLWGDATEYLKSRDTEDFVSEYKGNPVQKEFIEVKKGEVHFHHHVAWHGSHGNSSENPRRAYILHLFADGTCFDKNGPHASDSDFEHGAPIQAYHLPIIGKTFIPLTYTE